MRKIMSVIICIGLLLSMSACVVEPQSSGAGTLPPTSVSMEETTAPTIPTDASRPEQTEPTEPQETQPAATEPTQPHVHTWTTERTEPTCTTEGYTTYRCSGCGEVYDSDYVGKTEHSWNEGEVLVDATEETDGQMQYTCIVCGGMQIAVIPALGHTCSFEETIVTAPSCTTGGYTTYYCKCGESQIVEETAPLGHDWRAATCVEPKTCLRCGAKEGQIAEHSYVNGVCRYCGAMDERGSQGLSYTLSSDGTYYILSGFGTCTDVHIVIPSAYKGLPVKAIGDGAFHITTAAEKYHPQMKSVTIAASVTSIGYMAFEFGGLKEILVASGNLHFCVENGILYNISKTELIRYPSEKEGTMFSIPSSVTCIDDGAFQWCDLVTIEIPSSVTCIGDHAFSSCGQLPSITIPSSVKTIGAYAFFCCDGLREVCIPEGVASIGDHAFSSCGQLPSITIPSSVKTIGAYAFSGCEWLREVHIHEGVTSIGDYAFSICLELPSIAIPNSVERIGEAPFAWCQSLGSVSIQESNPHFFYDNGMLYNTAVTQLVWVSPEVPADVTVLQGVLSIDTKMFTGRRIKTIVIPDSVLAIGEAAFGGCGELLSITIPNSVVTIGKNAFYGCGKLKCVEISDSVTQIGAYAFYECTGLTDLTIGKNVKTIGDGAFSSCGKLSDIQLPSGVTTIGHGVFSDCIKLKSIVLPDSVTSIGIFLFNGCTNLTSVTIGKGITSIEDAMFEDCANLTSITIPKNVTRICTQAFWGCGKLKSVIFEDPYGWFVDGSEIDLSNPAIAAQYVREVYSMHKQG